ncbi:hypothetical protein M0R45_021938 [Rubus argutus]|uniref:Uncharacterized protein n=1 Tax=Rubus argutus TaxID=59490 RepID=A0AAW1XEJ8_RUBAR
MYHQEDEDDLVFLTLGLPGQRVHHHQQSSSSSNTQPHHQNPNYNADHEDNGVTVALHIGQPISSSGPPIISIGSNNNHMCNSNVHMEGQYWIPSRRKSLSALRSSPAPSAAKPSTDTTTCRCICGVTGRSTGRGRNR